MKQSIKYFFLTISLALCFTSCGDKASLQRYFVEHQETKDFISQDFPLSMIEVDKSNFTEKQMEAYHSVDKLNFIGFKVNADNLDTYKAEVAKVKNILNDSKYNDLMAFNIKGDYITVKYLGTDDVADELIIFGSSQEKGFGIIRVLGSDMNPEKLATLMEAMQKADFDKDKVENIVNFFK
ncbi:DUF4252 domain-containing protein [Tamlana sp. 2_MG-2023]|uniref:DUF4252 domain-containing protein n=1 Tax=unclassified Tamlana TaxID=2614803 RepID=UPI0026E19539|nr:MULTISPECIES: DUF4252 domain-containing protein [unclassified Tamlana]MDO6760039.1 DUF4252 domain-containing protein [Tamlana sp. 2_MG-2023]MDO6790263.1 DUF4252 domain-containing protein [Tamlana sp. 1_MG-2023]